MNPDPVRRSLAAALVLLAGCGSGWQRAPATPTTVIPARKQVLIYHGAVTDRWHAATISADSISGVQWMRPIECDSCRVALPLALVDSIRIGDPSTGFVQSIGLAFGIMLAMIFAICHWGTPCTWT